MRVVKGGEGATKQPDPVRLRAGLVHQVWSSFTYETSYLVVHCEWSESGAVITALATYSSISCRNHHTSWR